MVAVLTRFARQCANGPMSPRLHASARKHFERDRLTDEAVLYAYEHALTGPSSASVLVVPHMLIDPRHPHACEAGGVIRCGLQAWLDVGPHGVPRGCELSGQASDGGSFEAQLSDRPADRPGAQTRPGCAHPLVVFQECHRLAGVFAAYPAPYCAIGTLPGPRA